MVRFSTFPRTETPPDFAIQIVEVFRRHASTVGTEGLTKGLTSDQVLAVLAEDLELLGFQIEKVKASAGKVERPVFFGENGIPTVRYEVDGYHAGWRCGLEVEAGRAWMGNAVYRDLVQALVMVEVDWLCLAVPVSYKYQSTGRSVVSRDYENSVQLAEALYGHSRMRLPYRLLLVGY